MNELVSVVVTCYNHQDYIEQCLRSIFTQTYCNIELFVYNDGSTDQSGDIIQTTLQDSPFLNTVYEYHNNMGLVKTRNKAFDKIQGEFLLFVDSDNYLSDTYIEELIKVARSENADIVYGGLINPTDDSLLMDARPFDLEDLFISNFIESCSLMRVVTIANHRYDIALNYKKLEDYDFFLHLIVKYNAKACPAPKAYFYYRIIENSMSRRGDTLKHYQSYIYILGKYNESYSKFIQKALEIHFDHNIQLENYAQYVTIYFDNGYGFNQEDIMRFPLKQGKIINFTLNDEIRRIRVDLSEIPSFYYKVSLVDVTYQTEILPAYTNAVVLGDSYIFPSPDPQLIYEIYEQQGREFRLTYQMYNIENIYREDYIGKTLANEVKELERKIVRLTPYKARAERLEKANEQLRAELEEMTIRYNSVTHSRRWTIPTKIIDLLKRR